MKKYLLATVLFALSIIMSSCKRGITDNGGGEEKRIKTPREMTWTADTLKPLEDGFQLTSQNLLVFSPNDIWLCCDSDVARGLLWHYDGKKWTESNIRDDVGGMRVNDIAGYSSKDLWACGYSGEKIFLAHYNGQHWSRADDRGIKGELLDMCKDSSGNLWACGRNGVIMKYDKTKWIADTINVGYFQQHPKVSYLLKSVEYYKNNLFVLINMYDSEKKCDVYNYVYGSIDNWTIADSMIINSSSSEIKWGNWGLYKSPDNNLLSFGGHGVWKNINGVWEKMFTLDGEVYGICGVNMKHMIAASAYKRIFFYDGNSWESISNLFNVLDPIFVFKNSWTDGYETFVIGYGNIGSSRGAIIFHGK